MLNVDLSKTITRHKLINSRKTDKTGRGLASGVFFFCQKALTEMIDRCGRSITSPYSLTTTYFSLGFPAFVTNVAVPKLPLPSTLMRRYRSMVATERRCLVSYDSRKQRCHVRDVRGSKRGCARD